MKSVFGAKAADSATRRWISPLLFLMVIALSFTLLYRTTTPAVLFPPASLRVELSPPVAVQRPVDSAVASDPLPSFSPRPVQNGPESQDVRLDRVLRAAATRDNTVILTSLNAFWSTPGSVLDLFLESFRVGNGTIELLNHLVIVAVDDKAYERCLAVHDRCFDLKTEGVDFSGEKVFNTPEYLDMMWARLDFLRVVLEKGYNFIFSVSSISSTATMLHQSVDSVVASLSSGNFVGKGKQISAFSRSPTQIPHFNLPRLLFQVGPTWNPSDFSSHQAGRRGCKCSHVMFEGESK
ncbi:hypothetical protein B296_00006471 [Ensete ventricosum]|uniref:Nucleotide-diphospho-sugar transferase domain-containing protein n=1 Tax=Ensete ventricosum TaxID=4639 RepID=A0A426ZP50_ENSVE|nr:hypothetical protein B296_00006471 [Ensete ventricosum]